MTTMRADSADFDAIVAGADLSSSLHLFCKINSSERLVLAGSGEDAVGVITEGNIEGRAATYQRAGIAKVIAAGVVAAGAKVMSDSTGKATTATGAGVTVMGTARNGAAAAGELIAVVLDKATLHA